MNKKQMGLALAMEDISQDHYCAGWMRNLEYSLWKMIIDRSADRQYGMYPITDEQLDRLLDLSRECGGWIIYLEDAGSTFVTMEKWLRYFTDHKAEAEK